MSNTQQLPEGILFKSRLCWFFELPPLIYRPVGAFLGAVFVTVVLSLSVGVPHIALPLIEGGAIVVSLFWCFYAAADWTYEYLVLDRIDIKLESHKPMFYGGHGGATVAVAHIKKVDHYQTGPERWLAWATRGRINCGAVKIDTEVEEDPRLKTMRRVPNHMDLYNAIKTLLQERSSQR